MATYARALGRLFDIGLGITTVNLATAANTGKNCSLQECEDVGVLVFKSASGTTDGLACDQQEVNGYNGTPRDLDIITNYWVKGEATLDNDEAWVLTTQTAASEITAIASSAAKEMMVYFEVLADQLSDDYTHIAVNVPDLGATDSPLGGVFYIPFGLKTMRKPANLTSLLRPGVANA